MKIIKFSIIVILFLIITINTSNINLVAAVTIINSNNGGAVDYLWDTDIGDINSANSNAWVNNNINDWVNLNISTEDIENWDNKNTQLDSFWNWENEFFQIGTSWWKGIFYTLVSIAQSLKNLFYLLATVFYLYIAIKLIIAENTEEESAKFKKWIIWITVWLIIMQLAYSFVSTLYANSIWEKLAFDLITNIINPFIWLMEVLASVFFLAIAIFAFYRMVTANWKEEEVTRAKMSIVYAIMWFILIKIAKIIVEWVYGKLECSSSTIAWFDIATISCIWDNNADSLVWTIMQIINWANWFICIITILLILYAWFNVLFSAWDEEKIKKAKSTILYIAIGILLLVINYLLLTFFILPETTI